ncbi:hypothetical protein H072_4712 [Dactylellina haptotyla CBS 200.50]|uniref:CENP-V/GFA domain-containing protein n=1 Tax=Dactylellina haptotyla (strain CBS 200.50) TaxID=1284197 RepID=S8AJU0_DACHA|nr:hypothetical protein H072_4712 [Dactylellina haptotyla CBS 200.50]
MAAEFKSLPLLTGICRKTLGGLFATLLHIPIADFLHESKSTLKIYQSSEYGRRGFCTDCGGGIYFYESDEPDGPIYCVAAGSVDTKYLNGELLAGLKRDLYSIMAVEGVDDAVGKGLERHVAGRVVGANIPPLTPGDSTII